MKIDILSHIKNPRALTTGRIEGVNLARALGALGIIIYHYRCFYHPFQPILCNTPNFNFGSALVAMFFSISGACLVRTYSSNLSLKDYLRRRWMGIFPMYFIAYVFVAACWTILVGRWWDGIPAPRFLLTLIGMDGLYRYRIDTFYQVGEWYVGALLYCYLLFPLLRAMQQRIPHLTLLLLLTGTYFLPDMHYFEIEAFRNIINCCTMFYLGMWAAQYPQLLHSKVGLCVSSALLLIISLVPLHTSGGGIWLVQNVIGGWLGFVALTQVGSYIGQQGYARCIMRHLGELAFPFFLLQSKVIEAVLIHWNMPDAKGGWIILAATICVCWLFSEGLLLIHRQLIKGGTKKSH